MSGPDPLLDRPAWAPTWVPTIDDVRQVRLLRWALGVVLVAGVTACVVRGADGPADPVVGGPPTSAPSGLAAAFGTVLVEVLTSSGDVLALCLLHADQPEERQRGLAGATDLEGHDGILFANDGPVDSHFAMIDTTVPLTVTWWADDGAFVSGADMDPCTEADPGACPRYAPAEPYRWAIEVPRGAPATSGIGEGAALLVGAEGCAPTAT